MVLRTILNYKYNRWLSSADPTRGPVVRGHWAVENSLHWVLDMVFRDDECRDRKDHAPANFTTLKHMAHNLIRKARNQYSERLLERSRDRFAQWNGIATELKEVAVPFVRRKVRAAVEEHSLPKVCEDTVQWDILGVCMEAEYADVYPPGFYASQAYWYVKGHIPCSWKGIFPEGILIVY